MTTTTGMTGAEAQARLEAAGIVCDKQLVPDDVLPPMRTSGMRLGTPAATVRGMKQPEMKRAASLIDRVMRASATGRASEAVVDEVRKLVHAYPVPTLN